MPAPANDLIGGAQSISVDGTVSGTLASATSDAYEQAAFGAAAKTVFYRYDNSSGVDQAFTASNLTSGATAGLQAVGLVGPSTDTPTDYEDMFTLGWSIALGLYEGDPSTYAIVGDGQTLIFVVTQIVPATDPTPGSFTIDAAIAPYVAPPAGLDGRVSIGFDDDMLEPDPDWTVIDTLRDNLVSRIEIRDGRQTENDETEAGTCTVYLNDRTGLFDPNNVSSPYFGKLDGKPIAIACWNPVDEEWVPQWRGTIDDWQTTLNPATKDGVSILANVQIEAVGIFDYLARAEMRIGVSGTTPPSGSEGTIFYDEDEANERVKQMLGDAGVDSTMYTVFSLNVNVLPSQYDPGDDFLGGIREAVDAEQPFLGNVYEDKLGRVCVHGRFSRLDPDATWTSIAGSDAARDAVWKFRRWKAGDGAAITLDPDCAQIRELAFARPRDILVNSSAAWPEKNADGSPIDEADIPGQLSEDATSIGQHGIHSRTFPGLIVKGHKTNGDTGWQQCKKYSDFLVAYYAQPLQRVERIVFKSVRPTDARAAATWAVLTGASISDVMNVNVGYPGGTGMQDADHYIEGRVMTIQPLKPIEQGGFDMVTLELNLSPYIEDTEGIFG